MEMKAALSHYQEHPLFPASHNVCINMQTTKSLAVTNWEDWWHTDHIS
jgi:hypothetical protein